MTYKRDDLPYRDGAYRKPIEPYGYVKNNRLYKVAYKDKNLTHAGKALLSYIVAHCDQNGSCFLSLSKVAKEQSVTRQAIQNRLRALISQGYILRKEEFSKNGNQKSNTYQLNFEKVDKDLPLLTETSCTTATILDGTPANSENCTLAMPLGCTKIPYKKPLEECSNYELNEILKEVRDRVFEPFPTTDRAKIMAGISKQSSTCKSERERITFEIKAVESYRQ